MTMKFKIKLPLHAQTLLALLAVGFLALNASAEGAAFLYRGHLEIGGAPADGNYDMSISLCETNRGGAAVAGPVVVSAAEVKHGMFTARLDFGPGPFSGTNYWLDISARRAGETAFSATSVRSRLKPSPYAHGAPRLVTSKLPAPAAKRPAAPPQPNPSANP